MSDRYRDVSLLFSLRGIRKQVLGVEASPKTSIISHAKCTQQEETHRMTTGQCPVIELASPFVLKNKVSR